VFRGSVLRSIQGSTGGSTQRCTAKPQVNIKSAFRHIDYSSKKLKALLDSAALNVLAE